MSLTELTGSELPIVQAPMAGVQAGALAIAVAEAGGPGSLPCAMLDADGIRDELTAIRDATDRPVNVNFFCHEPRAADADREAERSGDFSPLWAGQNASGCREVPAARVVEALAAGL